MAHHIILDQLWEFKILQNEKSGQCDLFSLQDIISFMITTESLNRTWLGFLNSEDMISEVNIYVMDIVWISCDVCV